MAQRLAYSHLMRVNNITCTVGTGLNISLQKGTDVVDIPGDGFYTHIRLRDWTAESLDLPSEYVEAPDISHVYTTGDAEKKLEQTTMKTMFGDAANCYMREVSFFGQVEEEVEVGPLTTTTVEWGGAFEVDMECLFDEDGEIRQLDSTKEFYVNTVAPKYVARNFKTKNPECFTKEVDSKNSRIVFGRYRGARLNIIPPLSCANMGSFSLILPDIAENIVSKAPAAPSVPAEVPRLPGSIRNHRLSSAMNALLAMRMDGPALQKALQGDSLLRRARAADKRIRVRHLERFKRFIGTLEEGTEYELEKVMDHIRENVNGEAYVAFMLRQLQNFLMIDFSEKTFLKRVFDNDSTLDEEDWEITGSERSDAVN